MFEPTPLPPPTRRTLQVLLGFLLLAVVGLAGLGLALRGRQTEAVQSERTERLAHQAEGLPIRTAQVQDHSAPRRISLPGDVRAFRQVSLYAKVGGYLEKITVDKGDSVKAGQLLAVVKSPESDQIVQSLQAALGAKVQLVRRYRGLVSRGVVSEQEMDKASADLAASRAELRRYEALRDYETLTAPYDGVITARYVDPGALIPAAATQASQPLLDLADTQSVRVYFYVGQAEASFVHVGDGVELSGGDDVPFSARAKISRVAHALDVRSRTMLAEVDLDNRDGRLVPGLFLQIGLEVRGSAAVSVPSGAILIRDGHYLVARIDAHQRVHLVPVEVGSDDGHRVHILTGLAAGDWVGVGVGDAVDEGTLVQPHPIAEETAPSR